MHPVNSEKGLDPNNAQAAIDRACQLVEEMGAGEVVGGMVDVYPEKREPVRVPFDADADQQHCWEQIFQKKICWRIFKKIELAYDETTMKIIAPTFRQDLFRTGRSGRGSGKILWI
ncbi:MAG: hypothetical protein ACLUTZ_03985 [Oliverpabstia sp.]